MEKKEYKFNYFSYVILLKTALLAPPLVSARFPPAVQVQYLFLTVHIMYIYTGYYNK